MRSLYKTRAALKIKVLDYLKDKSCAHCGMSDREVLEFDHVERSTKTDSVARMINARAKWPTIQAEIAKCQVLCANCHKKKTLRETQYWKFLEEYMASCGG